MIITIPAGEKMNQEPQEIIQELYAPYPELKVLLLKHSLQVQQKALEILENASVSLDCSVVKTGALLHDIGIFRCDAPGILCRGSEPYIAHGVIGAELLRKYGPEWEPFARICERHTGSGLTCEDIIRQNLPLPHRNYLPETAEEKLICLADKFFSKSGTMEEKPLISVRRSMSKFGPEALARFDALCALFEL